LVYLNGHVLVNVSHVLVAIQAIAAHFALPCAAAPHESVAKRVGAALGNRWPVSLPGAYFVRSAFQIAVLSMRWPPAVVPVPGDLIQITRMCSEQPVQF
jgi:hypothetical protein